MANAMYTSGLNYVLNNDMDNPGGNGLKWALLNATYTYAAGDANLSDIVGGERVALTGAIPSLDATTGGTFDGGTATASAVNNGTITQAALYYDSGVEATSTLIAFVDGLSLVTNGSDVNVVPHANGIIVLS